MTQILVQLRDAIVVIEAPCGADYVVDVLRKDGYDARQVSGMVVVKERLADHRAEQSP